jgi:hypothetical protein
LEETHSIKARTSKKKRQRTIYVPETSTVERRRGKKLVQRENCWEMVQTEQQDDFFKS